MTETDYDSAVALIGMSGRFPGADSPDALWRDLMAGVPGLRELSEEELLAAGVAPGRLADPGYVRVGGPVAGLDLFDAAVFGFNPRETELLEPQHRLFLECAWEAMETAGYCPTETPGQVGVFGGCGFPDYIVHNIMHLVAEAGLLAAVGTERDSLTSLVSYKLGLRGPSVAVQTFCSTSLVAVHLACQSLLTYECDIALAGGAFTPLPQSAGYQYEPGGILSPDGTVRSFDASANGTVMGSGAGVVALKRMREALEDGDVIHAVVLGSAVNNDGRVRAGYTAPGVDGQAEVIEAALGVAGVKPESIGYVECHATGTMLGDSIELAAVSRVFARPSDTPCVLGTAKPLIGHLDRASGVTGLMRAAMALENRTLLGTPGYRTPNPALATALDRFTVIPEHRPWDDDSRPRRAGVNSFGLGGTNAHVVLEEAPQRPERPARPGPHLITFSAVDDQARTALTERLRAHLQEHRDADIADVAYTLQVSRGGFATRRAVVCADHDDAVAALADPTRWIDGRTQRRNPRVRLVVPADAADQTDAEQPAAAWWAELQATAAAIVRPDAAVATTADGNAADARAAAVDAVADALTRLGVRVVRDAAETAEAEELVVDPQPDQAAADWLLAAIAQVWLAGGAVDWPALHHGEGRRVQLPTYPFQRRRYWVDPDPAALANATAVGDGKVFDRSAWTYLPTWEPRPLDLDDLDERLRDAGPWLVFADDERGEAVIDRLDAAGAIVTAVRPGEDFGIDDDGGFTVRITQPDDIAEVMHTVAGTPQAIVHAFSLGGPEAEPGADPSAHFDAAQRRGFTSALALARELVDGTGPDRVEIALLTPGAVGVLGSDLRAPEHSTLAALAPSLTQENPSARFRSIDVDAPPAAELGQLATQVLAAVVGEFAGPAAVRAGEHWTRRYQPCPIEQPGVDGRTHPIRQGDTVLITGGLGDVGLVLARHFAATYGCRLVLTARSPLPPRAEWQDRLVAAAGTEDRVSRHIRNILDLEERGAEVLAVSADVADVTQMRAVVDAAVERFGGIDVAVHAAGVQDGQYFTFAHLLDSTQCDAHLSAKVKGFHVLQTVLAGHCPDRRITLSSLAAVLGGITLAPYASANAALDAYVRAARRAGEGNWVTVDWDTWDIDPDRVSGHSSAITDFAMEPAEGIDVFERALSAADRVGHLVISTGSLDARVERWVIGDIHDTAGGADDDRERHPRPELDNPFVAPLEGVETALAEVWSRVLGIEPVGATDNFFELGGHSLIAIELTARIRTTLDASIPVTGLLECPTVRELAQLVTPAPEPAQ